MPAMNHENKINEAFANLIRTLAPPNCEIDFSDSVYINRQTLNDFAEHELPAITIYCLEGEPAKNNKGVQLLGSCEEVLELAIEGFINVEQGDSRVALQIINDIKSKLFEQYQIDKTLGGAVDYFSYKDAGGWGVQLLEHSVLVVNFFLMVRVYYSTEYNF